MNVSKDLNGNDEVILKIKDIMNNQYDYKVDIKYKDEKYCEIMGLTEKIGGIFTKSRLF